MRLRRYLKRIGWQGDVRPDRSTLYELHRLHVCTIPFENLDVQLRRPLTTDVDAAYEKIVIKGRGGWCYEQNGLFGRALSQVGFDVTRLSANVMRQQKGEFSDASHLSLLVRLPDDPNKRYVVDVGFGGSMIRPIELTESEFNQPPFRIGLRKLDDGHWRFWEDLGKGEFSYDFLAQAADESALSKRCDFLQSDPSSGFVQNLVAQRRRPDAHKVLHGRVYRVAGPQGTTKKILNSPEELVEILANEFSLNIPEIADLWPKVVARHEEFQREKSEN